MANIIRTGNRPDATGNLTRRRLLALGVAGVGATVFPSQALTQAKKGNRGMPEGGKTVLIICDYQLGIGDLPFAKAAVSHAAAALETGRKAGMLIVFTKVAFQPGYTDISPDNQAFATYKAKDLLPPPASRLIPTFQPRPNEILLNKDRFNAFIGNDLRIILRAQDVKRLVIAGVATSGVVVSTFCAAADEDFELIILSDACADPNPRLNDELMTNLFPRSARVLSVSAWAASLTA